MLSKKLSGLDNHEGKTEGEKPQIGNVSDIKRRIKVELILSRSNNDSENGRRAFDPPICSSHCGIISGSGIVWRYFHSLRLPEYDSAASFLWGFCVLVPAPSNLFLSLLLSTDRLVAPPHWDFNPDCGFPLLPKRGLYPGWFSCSVDDPSNTLVSISFSPRTSTSIQFHPWAPTVWSLSSAKPVLKL